MDVNGTAWRAALDRAESLEDFDQASILFDRAERTGDELPSKALALRAVSRWPQLSDRYGEDHPETTAAIVALGEFQRETNSPSWRLEQSMRLSPPPAPPELGGMSEGLQSLLAREA
jgi:hypothetical protein